MNHLSGLDAMFLHIESPEMPMHIGSLNVLDLPEGHDGEFFEQAREAIAARLHLAPVFTRKLALMPFDLSDPVWVEDEDIDIDYHVRHISLPKPGTNRQLQQYVARLHSTLLDRSRPLWEIFIIDGLKSGQVALYAKVHHAGIDGQGGVAVAKALFDLEPRGRVIKAPRPRPRRNEYQLGMAELAGAALRNAVHQYAKLLRMAPSMLRAVRDVAVPAKDANGKRAWGLPRNFKLFGPRTLLNVAITNQRTFAGRTISLAETKSIAKAFGASLNDVVMTTTAGALRRYLQEYDNLPAKPLVAAVPVSLRAAGDESANNQVSMLAMTLATDIADPVERLRAIHAASDANKQMMGRVKAAIPNDFPMLGAPWLVSGLASLWGRSRVMNVIPPVANLVISNVAGIPVPLYFAGARMACYYPVSIPAHGMALNVTVQSYNGRMDYGLIACRRIVPDINDLGDYLLAEHQALLARAQAQAQDPVGSDAKPAAVAKTRSRAAPAATGKATSGARAPAARKRTTTHGKLALVGATHPARKRRA
ncbi:MAG: wax ester/triacylglycerol synthase family O-acyltransferase [Ramlibacter sp.]|nr:wax ester/triacylglycerol synthase family O-acyltransferase [Ramlibacter sp.]